MNILVLAGGLSPEREVSLVSGSRIAKALIEKGHCVCLLDLYYGIEAVENLSFTDNAQLIKDYSINKSAPESLNENVAIGNNVIEACKRSDLVYLALHGDIGENGKLQALLTLNNIPYTGSEYDGCYLSMNKNISKIIAMHNGIKTARWSINELEKGMNFPCVVKPVSCGSSIGITIVNNMAELYKALSAAREYDSEVMIEEYISGREFSVGILDDKALPPIKIVVTNGFYDYKNKYQQGLTQEICPADVDVKLSQSLQDIALKMHKLLHLSYYSRIDFIVTKNNEIYFLEANSLPGMTPTSLLPQEARAVGIDYNELCNKIAINALLKKHQG